MKRKRYSKEFKVRVALDAIKGQKTAAKLASEYGIHVSLINTYKTPAEIHFGQPMLRIVA